MRTLFPVLPMLLLAAATAAPAQTNPPAPAPEANPMSAFTREGYAKLKEWVVRSAEKMPEESYGFKPADTVRSFGQVLGHVAASQYRFCSAVLVETNPPRKAGETKSAVIAALADAFAYCDRAYASLTDVNAMQPVKGMWGDMPKLHLLTANDMHLAEHYGSLTTYLRIKGIVPPSSEPGGMSPQPKK